MTQDMARNILSKHGLSVFVAALVLCGLYFSKLYNYLLFHTLIELFGVIVSFLIFALVWNSRHLLDSRYLAVIGIASLFSGILGLLHALAYKGMGIFTGHGADLPTQLWIAFRYLVSLSFLTAPLLMKPRVSDRSILFFYAAVTAVLLWMIFSSRFPACFIEGSGLTRFKIWSEYVIAVIFVAGLGLLHIEREKFDSRVFRWMSAAIVFSVIAELCFTQYVSVYGQANMIGHFFLFGSVALIYRAIVITGIAEPSSILFRDLKLSEERIRESEERYRSLVELSPDAIAVHCDGRYVYINPSGVMLFAAADAQQIIGRNVLDLIHPEYREQSRERMQKSYRERIADSLQEVKMLRLDGGEFEVETISAPIIYASKRAVQMVIRDITQRKQAEKEIEHLASFPRLNPSPVIELDAECNIIFANKATESILSSLNAGNDAGIFIPPGLKERLKTLGKGTGTETLSVEINLKDRFFLANVFLSHTLRVARIYATDITEQKRVERELEHKAAELAAVNKELETFSYSVSHDLRAPLRHITGFVELLYKSCAGGLDEKNRHYLEVIADSSKQMGKLIDELLSFSRTGRAEISRRQINTNDLVRQSVDSLNSETRGRHIAWEIGPLPDLFADPVLLKLVWTNLIANAVKFTRVRAEAKIEIAAEDSNKEYIFRVQDNGVGFDMKYKNKLFAVFQRLHRTEDFEGTGIGLANVQRIIHRHGGKVWAEGEPEKGAVFFFSIPK